MFYEEYKTIGKEAIPNAEKELSELSEEMEQKSQALDDVLAVSAQVKSDKNLIEALVQPLKLLIDYFQKYKYARRTLMTRSISLIFKGQLLAEALGPLSRGRITRSRIP